MTLRALQGLQALQQQTAQSLDEAREHFQAARAELPKAQQHCAGAAQDADQVCFTHNPAASIPVSLL